jgi:hypothetical protein
MDIEEALVAYLKTKNITKIYPDEIPQNVNLPAATYIKISDIKDHYLTGICELERPIFQFTAYALTKTAARTLAKSIKTALSDYQGTLSGIQIQKIELQNELSNLETSPDGITRVFTEDLEFEVNYIKE